MSLDKFFFATTVAQLPADIERTLGAQGEAHLSDEQDERFTDVCGVAPGPPEAFATRAARDARLGPFGAYARVIETSWGQAVAAGFTASEVAIGHQLGEAGFDRVAKPVLDAVARKMQLTGEPGMIVIARSRYEVSIGSDGQIDVAGGPLELNVTYDVPIGWATVDWLREAFSARLVAKSSAMSSPPSAKPGGVSIGQPDRCRLPTSGHQ